MNTLPIATSALRTSASYDGGPKSSQFVTDLSSNNLTGRPSQTLQTPLGHLDHPPNFFDPADKLHPGFHPHPPSCKNPSSNGTPEEEKHHTKLTDTRDANHHPDFHPSTEEEKAVPWEKDAVNPGFSSMQILLDWITAPGNFEKWRGKKGEGVSKEFLASQILQKMVAQGINHRIARDIRTKIQEIQTSFTIACNFLRNTGQGLLAKDIANGTNDIRGAVVSRRLLRDVRTQGGELILINYN
ncbi:hypothetical protein MJO29_003267 [Puccinia striiformis f. sp. tritici]|nr:hypothetical protein MJO29_003267 [Puccinia striiformis f. sp. tritici]